MSKTARASDRAADPDPRRARGDEFLQSQRAESWTTIAQSEDLVQPSFDTGSGIAQA